MKLWVADSHVHFHKCFNEEKFFDNCFKNILQASQNSEANGILFLTQGKHEDSFNFLRQKKIIKSLINPQITYSISNTQDNSVIELKWNKREIKILIISGFQIITRENLEVLSLGTAVRQNDSLPIRETIIGIKNLGGIPILPWGFGKWYGKRGKLINEIIDEQIPNLFLGDNGGRANLLLYPQQFNSAAKHGIRVLPGSDPLPFPGEEIKPLSFGFKFIAEISISNPWADVKKILLADNFSMEPFGKLTSPWNFIKSQLAVRFRK